MFDCVFVCPFTKDRQKTLPGRAQSSFRNARAVFNWAHETHNPRLDVALPPHQRHPRRVEAVLERRIGSIGLYKIDAEQTCGLACRKNHAVQAHTGFVCHVVNSLQATVPRTRPLTHRAYGANILCGSMYPC